MLTDMNSLISHDGDGGGRSCIPSVPVGEERALSTATTTATCLFVCAACSRTFYNAHVENWVQVVSWLLSSACAGSGQWLAEIDSSMPRTTALAAGARDFHVHKRLSIGRYNASNHLPTPARVSILLQWHIHTYGYGYYGCQIMLRALREVSHVDVSMLEETTLIMISKREMHCQFVTGASDI
eukprot:6202211-Pleurochrysis_carterae.AAC.1